MQPSEVEKFLRTRVLERRIRQGCVLWQRRRAHSLGPVSAVWSSEDWVELFVGPGVGRKGSSAQRPGVSSAGRPGSRVTDQGQQLSHIRSGGERGFSLRISPESIKRQRVPAAQISGPREASRSLPGAQPVSSRAQPPERATAPGVGPRSRGSGAASPTMESAPPLRQPGHSANTLGARPRPPSQPLRCRTASRPGGSGKRASSSAALVGLSRDRSPLLGAWSVAVGFG
ncbi:hypothetical protein NDU88_004127 [Pleurodeles waltl]|uniref:Uncharacterized protein n=1 Tax=Pleurodeles waltl TaxID=8319 RepID=A0AAV7LJ10_PLEWA|nr:hypothetical protein NDU88_004127 [Pleurodeles waltl]